MREVALLSVASVCLILLIKMILFADFSSFNKLLGLVANFVEANVLQLILFKTDLPLFLKAK